ncbi:hypothetical protein LGQ02_07065 [Bacillus shivajii]|uniref:hypothetical protein n=1 Tax=Bacillus shivajii TaxID=1983719 RepID=UPI001CFA3EFE|nr:hypothetical protein [Bacillus shivajii]UCZ54515.1 hypothetical protein LGQ02_07065 [Bacillus shivajii]
MDERKKIIVNEIKYWRKNKLLPATYCNFLLQLYSEGTEDVGHERNNKQKRSMLKYIKPFTHSVFLLAMITLTFLVIYFTQFSDTMQITMISFALIVAILGSAYFHRKGVAVVHLYVISAAFLSFILTIQLVDKLFPEQPFVLGGTIVGLCTLWIFSGLRWKFQYLFIAGGTGIILFFSFLLL